MFEKNSTAIQFDLMSQMQKNYICNMKDGFFLFIKIRVLGCDNFYKWYGQEAMAIEGALYCKLEVMGSSLVTNKHNRTLRPISTECMHKDTSYLILH